MDVQVKELNPLQLLLYVKEKKNSKNKSLINMEKGLLYITIDYIIEKLRFLNIVELFKYTTKKLYFKGKEDNNSNNIIASRLGTDIYIITKWITIILFWIFNINNIFINVLVLYLIITNLYTYFYYHTWSKKLESDTFNLDRTKRRFLNLILAFGYNVLCFAYLICVPFSSNFNLSLSTHKVQDSILFSIANTLSTSYDGIQAITLVGDKLMILETLTTFVFLTIIFSNSIPQIKN